MKFTIWKYSLAVADVQTLQLPRGARVLTVQVQGEQPQLWAAVDPEALKEPRTFLMYGTGHPYGGGHYISTFQLYDGKLVFHVFEQE